MRQQRRFMISAVVLLASVAVAVAPARGSVLAATAPTPTPTVNPAGPVLSSATASQLLQSTWQSYKSIFIQGDGRVIDHLRDSVSTSEGESYALLRSVWMNDRAEFDLVWTWSKSNLQVRKDKLFGYLWGQHGNTPNWSILDTSSASDADEDIALSLLFAGQRWQDSTYTRAALGVIKDIWRHEVVTIKGKPYLTAGSWAPSYTKPGPAIDPSYFAPYEYRIFAVADPSHPWSKLIATSYQVLTACTRARLGAKKSAGIPPNWCALSRQTGKVLPLKSMPNAAVYGYDAFRVMWRVALDYEWNKSAADRKYLESVSFLRTQWQKQGRLYSQYRHDGSVLSKQLDPTVYGGDIGNFLITDPAAARAMVTNDLLPLLQHNGQLSYFGQQYNYYEQNWVWFGLALASGSLPNLASPA